MARTRLTAQELEAIRAPLQHRATLAAWIAAAPWGIASRLRAEDLLKRYPRGLQPLASLKKGPLFGRDELVALLAGTPGKSAANLLAHLQNPQAVLPFTAVLTEALDHTCNPRQSDEA